MISIENIIFQTFLKTSTYPRIFSNGLSTPLSAQASVQEACHKRHQIMCPLEEACVSGISSMNQQPRSSPRFCTLIR
jgi:hypothetical protein